MADAAHLLVNGAGGMDVRYRERDMRITTAIVIGLYASAVPGQLKLESGGVVPDERVDP